MGEGGGGDKGRGLPSVLAVADQYRRRAEVYVQHGMFALHLKAGRIPWGVGGEGAEEIDTGRCGEGGNHGGREGEREIMVGMGKGDMGGRREREIMVGMGKGDMGVGGRE